MNFNMTWDFVGGSNRESAWGRVRRLLKLQVCLLRLGLCIYIYVACIIDIIISQCHFYKLPPFTPHFC